MMTIPEALEAIAWAVGDDTGTSSKTIWTVMTGISADTWTFGYCPSDASDFGRCYRLLQRFPAWRQRLPEVVERFPEWTPLVRDWDKLSALYEQQPDAYNKAVCQFLRKLREQVSP